jgi:hypothetical protein
LCADVKETLPALKVLLVGYQRHGVAQPSEELLVITNPNDLAGFLVYVINPENNASSY